MLRSLISRLGSSAVLTGDLVLPASSRTCVSWKVVIRTKSFKAFRSLHTTTTKMADNDHLTDGLDAEQIRLLQERCILIDDADNKIGSATKKECHLLSNINKGMLHRAFSVFLFNSQGELLLQQRSSAKITFPDHFTNTCCSHPLNFESELDETEAMGVKRAAQRKLKHELGIEPEQVPLDDFHYLTRILYKADNVPYDGVWGEHEVDYILFIQRDVDVKANENEVRSYRYVNKEQLKDFLENAQTDGTPVTPWFQLIIKNFLYKWWDNLDNLKQFMDHKTVHKM